MAQLRTDYQDEILDVSVNTQRKYRQVDNGDGTISFVDETEYSQQGDSFGAGDINATNQAVNDCFQSVSDGKALVASAITDKGVSTDATATFSQMATNISSIKTETTPTAGNKNTAQKGHNGQGSSSATASINLPANGTYIVTFTACQGSGDPFLSNSSFSVDNFSVTGDNIVENSIVAQGSNVDYTNGGVARLYSQSILVKTDSSDVTISRKATASGYGGNVIATIYAIKIG